jgi:hypothetical protein
VYHREADRVMAAGEADDAKAAAASAKADGAKAGKNPGPGSAARKTKRR